jgi:multidrug efflux system membrane fusion protein
VKPDSTVELRKVTVAATDGDRTAIATGLAAGERVVVDGQAGLSQGARVRDASIQRADAGHAATATN